ncbi:unnamed protein product [Rotaria sp. Silwood2]|nr:unnamed protein product [Rotaria sp. Silwood2]CAF4268720.1 unnamed protein product [Rotaria sp. Silwood2]
MTDFCMLDVIGTACNNNRSRAIKLIKRTSTMFVLNISYDCLISNSKKLAVFKDNMIVSKCRFNLTYFPAIERTNVIVTCENIENNPGRDWKFIFGSMSGHKSSVSNETFIITFEPVRLNDIMNISVTIDDNITIASMFVLRCDQSAEMKYLSYQCGLDGSQQKPLSDSCTFTCPVKPGMDYDVAVIRHPIQRYDGMQNVSGVFEMDLLPSNFYTKPNKASNFRVELSETNTTVALIHFTIPQGLFDYVHVACNAIYQSCNNSSSHLTASIFRTCTNCTYVAITPIIGGVEYTCWANTSRSAVSSVQYAAVNFSTRT